MKRGQIILLTVFSLLSGKIYSQVEGDTARYGRELNEIKITAFKQNTDLALQPVSATVLQESTIRENSMHSIKEISAYIPNLHIPDYGSKMTSPVYIRGIGSAKNAPSVGLYVDGVPYFDRSTFDFNITDIDRIEVLRGPQGTVYGRNTMGGLINVYTKSPFKYKGTDIRLSAGNYNSCTAGFAHYGTARNGNQGYSVSGNYLHAGGYFRNTFTGRQADPLDAASARVRLSWKIRPQLVAHLTVAYEYSDQDGYPYGKYDGETGNIQDISFNSPSFYRRNMSNSGLNIEYANDYFRLGSQTSFQYYDGVQGLDQDFSSEDRYYVNFRQEQKMYSQEFNIRPSAEGGRYRWQFGLFGFLQDYTQSNDADYRQAGRHVLQNIDNPAAGLAVYHQSTLNDLIINRLSLILGIRCDFEKTDNSLVRATAEKDKTPVLSPPEKADASFSQIVPKVSLQYAFGDKNLVYYTLAKGYKTGGFNTIADSGEDPAFGPEHSWCHEVGIKNSISGGLLQYDAAFFLINWNNQQISQLNPAGQGFLTRSAGKTESRGVEISSRFNPFQNLNFQASCGITRAKYLRYKESETTAYDGNYLPMVPLNTLAVGANYSVKTSSPLLEKITLHGQYTAAGKLYWNDANDVSQPYYGIFNGKISFMNNKFSIDLWAKNIGRKDYIAYYFTLMDERYVQKGKPFTCGANLNVRF
jgi:outer membrane receptor protein involved in Fe transport